MTEPRSWRMHYLYRNADLHLYWRITIAEARLNFGRQVYNGLQRCFARRIILEGYEVDAVFCRKYGEITFVEE